MEFFIEKYEKNIWKRIEENNNGSPTMDNQPVYVTKSFSPPVEKYQEYVYQILNTGSFTNNGPFLRKLEAKLKIYLNVDYCQFVTNGTVAIQLALHGLGITSGEVITTPFSYVATTSAILWERCEPIFVDIEPNTFCIDPNKIEAAITSKTKAILAVHVFGIPCDVDAIADIGKRYGIPVIYDAAHAFGSVYRGKSLLDYGNVSTCSFHATKLFHTIEGGAVICHDDEINRKIDLTKRFGHQNDDHFQLGINAKASEFQAAMGLCNLPYVRDIIADRKKSVDLYDKYLTGVIQRPVVPNNMLYNYAYYPAIFRNKVELLQAKEKLSENNIFIRRYFYPSLNALPYIANKYSCPISEDISSRIACLPLFYGLEKQTIKRICTYIYEVTGYLDKQSFSKSFQQTPVFS